MHSIQYEESLACNNLSNKASKQSIDNANDVGIIEGSSGNYERLPMMRLFLILQHVFDNGVTFYTKSPIVLSTLHAARSADKSTTSRNKESSIV